MVSDKLVYDFIGFSCLSVYCIAMYYVDSVRDDYKDHYNGNNPKVTLNDVCFAVHALLFTFVQIGQMSYYNGLTQLPSKLCLIGASVVILIIIFYLLLALYVDSSVFIMLYWLNFISYVKIAITMVKYIPQVLLNYQRKSTVGWSITACLLDLIGSVMSMLQLFLDCNDTNDWSGIVGDIVKFLLGLLSLGFDVIFIVQHYVLYNDRSESSSPPGDEKQQLLLDEGGGNEGSFRDEENRPSLRKSQIKYTVGQRIIYTGFTGTEEFIGVILVVHSDSPDGVPYYTIRYDLPEGDGSGGYKQGEKQTDGQRLRPYIQSPLTPSLSTAPLEPKKQIYYTNESLWE